MRQGLEENGVTPPSSTKVYLVCHHIGHISCATFIISTIPVDKHYYEFKTLLRFTVLIKAYVSCNSNF